MRAAMRCRHGLPSYYPHGAENMKKALLTGVALASLSFLPASAQVNSPKQPPNQPVAQQTDSRGAQQNANPAQLSRDEIMRAQQALDQKGFQVGKADGIVGQRTKQALNKFQQKQGLKQTGQLDQPTLSALGISQNPSTTGQGAKPQNEKLSSQPGSGMKK